MNAVLPEGLLTALSYELILTTFWYSSPEMALIKLAHMFLSLMLFFPGNGGLLSNSVFVA